MSDALRWVAVLSLAGAVVPAGAWPVRAGQTPLAQVWSIEAETGGTSLGRSVAGADVNCDGYNDLIVGAYTDRNMLGEEVGKVFVFYGSSAGLSTLADWSAEGVDLEGWFGVSVSNAGDVNGDGCDDLVVGASQAGKTFVYYGSVGGLPSTPSWWADSGQPGGANWGFSVAGAGDVDGDGFDDLVVGASLFDRGEVAPGAVFLFLGSANGLELDGIRPVGDPGNADWALDEDLPGGGVGQSVDGTGDVNGDGYDDVILSWGEYLDPDLGWVQAVAVFHGSAAGLSITEDWKAVEPSTFEFGLIVSSAGDVNGDGYDDVMVGADEYTNGEAYEGAFFFYYGSSSGLTTDASWIAEGAVPGFSLGQFGADLGDVNGDGFDDVVLGNGHHAGFVFLGSPSGLDRVGTRTVGAPGNADLSVGGIAYATAGDVNGDSLTDILIGQPNASPNAWLLQCLDPTDSDSDGIGDWCDVDDGLLLFTDMASAFLIWQDEAAYSSFNLYRGDLLVMRTQGVYTQDPFSSPNADQFCGTTNNFQLDPYIPPLGEAVHYLVTGATQAHLGTDSSGTPRPNDWPCP